VTRRVLVVDDDASIRETFEGHLRDTGYEVATAASAEQALMRISELDPGLVITDVRMPGMDGIELLRRLRAARPDISAIVITAHEEMRSAVAAMKAGAYDYLVKPLDLDQIDLVLERCFQERSLRRRAQHLSEEASEPYALDRMVGRDPRMIEIYKRIGAVADTRIPVLIRGETGTGKEVIARALHFSSEAAAEPFVAVNCTALPETLLESELFGHIRGSFTGATTDRKGRFEIAGAGAIFLDEIGDTSPAFQAKLLRVLQEREFHPLGSERPRRTDARVIAATHRDLERMVREGRFREDLYFRLRVVEIVVPPLRDREGDIAALSRHFVARIAQELHRPAPLIPPGVLHALERYAWPGNVRELENALSRAVVLARGGAITIEDLALSPPEEPAMELARGPDADLSLTGVERAHLTRVLRDAGGNKRKAARLLQVTRPRLDRLLERHGIVATEYGRGGNDSK
jgi:DNA-binding NtrC family response regulator